MKKITVFLSICLVLASCAPSNPGTSTPQPGPTVSPTTHQPATSTPTEPVTATTSVTSTATATVAITSTPTPQTNPSGKIPNFDHIVLILLENQDYASVIGSPNMPHLNTLAQQNVLLSNYFAVRHPSLPNYIALMSGSTQNITSDCIDCFVNQPNLADRIEASGRTWKSYLESMPSPCFLGNADPYVQKHNPLLYFDSVRLNTARCERSIVPLTSLDTDLAANQLPNFSFIMPNICNSGHDCKPDVADTWVNNMVAKLQASPALGKNSLIIITFDEGGEHSTGSCCGLGNKAGGQIAAVLISPMAQPGFNDSTAYSHYSLLKMILGAWNLPELGQSASAPQILAPWDTQLGSTTGNPLQTPSANNSSPVNAILSATPAPSTQVPVAGGDLSFPIRAAFYYPWFPQSWKQSGMDPFTHYHPSLGYYSEDDATVIQKQIAAMQYGKIQAGIASWWGQGHFTDGRIPALLQAGEKAGFHWALYAESEGQGDPSVEAIRSDLEYIRDKYASSPAYLKINGHFVVFVYADPNDGCGMADRWKQANTVGAYVVLKVFSGYRNCASQPDAWHQYAPAKATNQQGNFGFTISPGFWKATEANPRLARDLNQWGLDIQAMIASHANFQLITTFNEWGEGTSMESSTDWESPSGYGLYLDALHYDGILPAGLSLSGNSPSTTKP
jgi:hypothetical protein